VPVPERPTTPTVNGQHSGRNAGYGRVAVCERVNIPKPEASCNARADVKVKGRSASSPASGQTKRARLHLQEIAR
jgi:hypothetical protein